MFTIRKNFHLKDILVQCESTKKLFFIYWITCFYIMVQGLNGKWKCYTGFPPA